MEEVIGRFRAEAEQVLLEHAADRDLKAELGRRLLARLPLGPDGGTACRPCGLCDLAQRKITEHLDAPAECLFKGP